MAARSRNESRTGTAEGSLTTPRDEAAFENDGRRAENVCAERRSTHSRIKMPRRQPIGKFLGRTPQPRAVCHRTPEEPGG
jgi:hypothetical protein